MDAVLTVLILGALVLLIIFGGVKTFKRNLVAALLCLIFLAPIWMLWAFIELFTGKVEPKVYNVVVKNDD